jgi:hypothetical protein
MVRLIPMLLSTALLGLLSIDPAGAGITGAGGVTVGNATQTPAQSSYQSPPATTPVTPQALPNPEPRVALVIGNSNYVNAPKLANPGHDAQSMAELLNSAGFDVISATDLGQNDMIEVLRDFSTKVAARGPNTVAMVYYAGHGVQLAGENYLIPVDANITTPADLVGNSVRLVDVMGTLETTPSRMRIVVLDACRNNPFPNVSDAGHGLAIVDAPNGSIVGYSTAPGMPAQDGDNGHSPYTNAFLRLAREPNLPIEQLFKRVRLEVNSSTNGRQTPWESSSLTSDFYFFGDTAVAAARAPANAPVVQMASNLPSRVARQAYDFVLSEGSPEYYQEFLRLYPGDPLSNHIRFLLANWQEAAAWHKAVLANTPVAYKTFYANFGNSPYAQSALKLQAEPKAVPLMQFTRISNLQVSRPAIAALPNSGIRSSVGNGALDGGKVANASAKETGKGGSEAEGKTSSGSQSRVERTNEMANAHQSGGSTGFGRSRRTGGHAMSMGRGGHHGRR